MSSYIAFAVFALLAILDAVFATAMLQKKQWKWFNRGNPVLPNGQYQYDPKKRQYAFGILLVAYAVVFCLTAMATLLTQIVPVISGGFFLTAALYLHGAVLVLGLICNLVYLDNFCQSLPKPAEGDTSA